MSSRVVLISLSRYLNYWKSLRSHLEPHTQILAVVKANAYGLGAIPLAQTLQQTQAVDYLGVATVDEAHALRVAGIHMPILIFSHSKNMALLFEDNLEVAVYSAAYIRELGDIAEVRQQSISVHLKLNTGMNRLGCPPNAAASLVALIQSHSYLTLRSVWTHLSSADEPHTPHTHSQLSSFKQTLATLNLSPDTLIHCANSATCRYFQEAQFSMVRIGIDSFDSILTLKSKIQTISWVEAGEGISYGSTFITARKTQIATIEMGYADGIPRSFKGDVLIRGKRYPVVGRVCMDLMMVDLGHDLADPYDEVVFVGSQGQESISLDEFSHNSHRITYESLCAIGPRVERIYEN